MRLRSVVAIPPGGAGLEAALGSQADGVLFTLAEAGYLSNTLRDEARAGIAAAAAAGKAALVVVNHPRTRLLRDDLEAVVANGLRGVLLPHAVEPQDARDLAVALREFELQREIEPGTVAAFPVIDTARGLLRAPEIAHAAPRVGGLVFDGPAYAADISARAEESGPRLAYARGAVVAAARAYEGLPIVRGAELDLLQLAHAGFAGAILASARPVASANSVFAPTTAEAEAARAQAAAYDAARAEGAWVARTGSTVVDAHTARKARRELEQASQD